MKKLGITLASALVLGLSFTSCSSDSDGGGVSEAKLLGKWEFSKEKFSANGQAAPEMDYTGNQEGCSKDYLVINDGGTYTQGDYWNSDCDLDTFDGTWSLDGKTLMVDDEEYTVLSVSGSTLKIRTTYTEANVEWTDVYTFKKVAN